MSASSYIGLNQNVLTLFSNAGTVTPSNGSSYAQGQQVTITATAPTTVPGERYIFTGWTGSGIGSYSGTNNPATITMNSAITETATWEHQYQLTIISPQGTVTGNNTWYDVGTTATARSQLELWLAQRALNISLQVGLVMPQVLL